MQIEHLFCDMDGVLADFHAAALSLHGRPPVPLWPAAVTMEEYLGLTTAEIMLPILSAGPGFWLEMPPTEFAAEVVQACEQFCQQYHAWMSVLTDPSESPDSALGKVGWLVRHFPWLAPRCCLTAHKPGFVGRGTVLVDDRHHVAEAFCRAGGAAVVLPQPWNHWRVKYGPATPSLPQLLAAVASQPEPAFIYDRVSFQKATRGPSSSSLLQ